MKKFFILMTAVLASSLSWLSAQASMESTAHTAVASTSWTAAFADLAGVDDIAVIAPSELRHPPEYELTPSDIIEIQNATFFIYAGYERMMTTIQEGIPSVDRVDIAITTENDRQTVIEMAELIASYTGTTPRYEGYVETVNEGRRMVEELFLDDLEVCCHTMQVPLAEDLGLNIVATFGGNELSAGQIQEAAESDYDLIIDNYHNPVAAPLAEVSGARLVIWRNFPPASGRNALQEMVKDNIDALSELYD